MKPALYGETFIRSVEYITIIIMPESSSSSTSFSYFRHMSKTDAVKRCIFYNDDFIMRLLNVTQLWCSTLNCFPVVASKSGTVQSMDVPLIVRCCSVIPAVHNEILCFFSQYFSYT